MNTSLIVANDMQARLTIRLHARHVISLFGEDDVHSYSSDPQEDKVLFNYFASERFIFGPLPLLRCLYHYNLVTLRENGLSIIVTKLCLQNKWKMARGLNSPSGSTLQ